jgi:hypothetical protein
MRVEEAQRRRSAPVMDLAEPPLHAETMINSSMTESLILQLSAGVCGEGLIARGGLLFAAALDDEDILVSYRGVCEVSEAKLRPLERAHTRIDTLVSPFANFPKLAEPRLEPRRSQMPSTRAGWLDPLKTIAPRMVGGPRTK